MEDKAVEALCEAIKAAMREATETEQLAQALAYEPDPLGVRGRIATMFMSSPGFLNSTWLVKFAEGA